MKTDEIEQDDEKVNGRRKKLIFFFILSEIFVVFNIIYLFDISSCGGVY